MNFIQVTEYGKIELFSSSSSLENLNSIKSHYSGTLIEIEEDNLNTDLYYWNNGLVEKPIKPSPHHVFNYDTKMWVLDNDAAWIAVRTQRDALLASTDWTTLPDVPFNEETRNSWLVYRQALRDVTNQVDPLAIVWPIR